MGVQSDGNANGNNWKILIGLSVLCAVLVFMGGFLHRRALDSAIADRQAKSVAFVNTKVAAAAKHADLRGPMKDAEAARFTKQLGLPAGTDLRLFSTSGVPLYSSPGLTPFPADTDGIQSAAAGDQGRVVAGSDLRVYAPVSGKGAKPVAIAAVVSNYTQLRHDASGPLDAVRLPAVGLGIVLLIAGLLLMLRGSRGSAPATVPAAKGDRKEAEPTARSSGKSRVTGFDPVPVTVGRALGEPDDVSPEPVDPVAAEEPMGAEPATSGKTVFGLRLGSKKERSTPDDAPAPAPPAKFKRSLFARKEAVIDPPAEIPSQGDKAASALEREVAIRQALEDQLEQLRTRIQMQDVETANATKEMLAQIEAANRRAEEAEARAGDVAGPAAPPAPGPVAAADDGAGRAQQLEHELAEARSVTADAVARAEAMQRQLDAAQAAPPAASAPDPTADSKVAEAMMQLADAQQRATTAEQRASAAEQRAASVESVREELEVRVAQLGTKAGELEQRATELETSLNEANAGGDAVRAEIATLTATLAAANLRISELESTPAAPNQDDQAEIARLRGELANQMERAQSAEERVSTLQADLLAAERGVPALTDVVSPSADVDQPRQSESVDEVTLASRFASDEPDLPTSAPDTHDVSDVDGGQVEVPGVHEPEVHEPEVHEPEVQEWADVRTSQRIEPVVPKDGVAEPRADAWAPSLDRSEPPYESNAPETEPVEATVMESEPVEATVPEPEPIEAEVDVHKPIEAEIYPSQPSVAASVEPAQPQPTPTVEWHAPSASPPLPPTSASDGNGIPPPPADDARYDDIWTAAFAPPGSEPHENGGSRANAAEGSQGDPEPDTEPAHAEAMPEPAADQPSSDDLPSSPEDEMSTDDEMWSLRARLADAAARKKKAPPSFD